MSTKMGRPKIPKANRRAILLQARVSPEEHKTIRAAIGRASASEWIRKSLLSAAQKETA